MQIFVDGDALPNLLKPIILRSVERIKIPLLLVANKRVTIGTSEHISTLIVDAGPDEADNQIVEMVKEGDLVITADIPLADRVLTKGAHAIDHRGELYTHENIKQYLTMRNLMEELRDSGVATRGPAAFTAKDTHEFANALHRFLTKHCKE